MTIKDTFLRIFTWWNGQTFGTQFHTWRHGAFVGADEGGNRYYRSFGHVIDPSIGAERRWVIYNGPVDASAVPPAWRGWLTHTFDVPPSEKAHVPCVWEKSHLSNKTGSAEAYRPPGSALSPGARTASTSDYVPWNPGQRKSAP